tara:strand:- start:16816 stop:19005 length:2190 start_codon:yes stop_codon:yes gene_type:complete
LEGFYPANDQVLLNYKILEDEFGRDDNTILIGFKSDSLFSESVLQDLYQITQDIDKIDFLDNVFSLWSAEQINSDGTNLTFDPYLEYSKLGQYDLDQIKQSMISDPFMNGFLLNHTGNATAIAIKIDDDENTYPNRNIIIESISKILGQYEDKYSFHISGIPYFRNQYVNLLNDEIIWYISISSVIIILLLWYLYRTIWGVLFPMLIVWGTLLLTVALIQLSGGYLEILSSTIAPILLCVGVADAVHMISKYDDSRESGQNKQLSILEMMTTLGSTTFLTSVTTAIGFASLMSSTVVPMKMFGIYTAMGVLLAYIITIIFLPAALKLSRKKRVVNEKSNPFYPAIHSYLKKMSVLNRKHYKIILFSGFAITLFFLIGTVNLNVNGLIFDDIGEDSQLMQDSRFFSENISPQFPLEFIIDTGNPEGVISANLFERLILLEEHLLSYPEIYRVVGLHTLISEVHSTINQTADHHQTQIPDSNQAIAQYLLLLEISGTDDLFRLVDFDYRNLRITTFTEDAGSNRINEIRDEVQVFLSEHFPNESVITTGTTILSADLTEKIVYSLAWSIIIAVIAISLVMTFLFKNIRLILIALIPNILPLIIVAGIMGYFDIDIKPSTAIIFTIALGIAVDDSIHYLARFRIEYLRIGSINPALAATTVRTGRAIIITSMILIAGFGTLLTSAFTSTAMMGLMVCTTIFAALISDLFILPSLFYWLKPDLTNLIKTQYAG